MKMKAKLLFLLFIGLALFSNAQVNSQRPTISESYHILGGKYIQLENGTSFDGSDYSFGTFVRKRFGESRWEARYLHNYGTPSTFGLKRQFTEGDSKWFNLSILSNVVLDDINDLQYDASLSTTMDFMNISFTNNIRYSVGDHLDYIFLVCKQVSNKTAVFVEYANQYSEDTRFNNRDDKMNFGIVTNMSNDITLDISSIYDINRESYTLNLGMSFIIQ